MISSRGLRWVAMRTRFRSRSQPIAFVLGLFVTVAGAVAWYEGWFGPIRGSLAIGVGSSILAAAIVAYLSPANEAGYRKFLSFGIVDMWSSRQAIKDWVDWMHTARETCVLFGVAHGGWCQDKQFASALKDRLSHGVSFRVLFLNPNADAAEIRAREEESGHTHRNTQEKIRESIRDVWNIRNSLTAGQKGLLRLFVYNATASCGLTWVDKQMIVTHYLAGLPDLTSPALLLTRPQIGMERSLYDVYADNLEAVIQRMSMPVDESNIQEFLPQQPEFSTGVPAEAPAPPSVSKDNSQGDIRKA
jgi:hypothetical protein